MKSLFFKSIVKVVLIFGCLLLEACDDEKNIPADETWQSEHFRYHIRNAESFACESITIELERHFAAIKSYLNFSWDSDIKIDYYKYVNKEDFLKNSPCGTTACMVTTNGASPEIHDFDPFRQHELIHAYLYNAGNPPPLFVEGIAEALSTLISSKPDLTIGFEAAINQDKGNYPRGGWWVGHLLNTYGPKVVLSLYSNWDKTHTLEETEKIFFLEIGVSASTTWNDLTKIDDPSKVFVPIWQCENDAVDLNSKEQIITANCETPSIVRTFNLSKESDLMLLQNDGNSLRIGSCEKQNVPNVIIGKPFIEQHKSVVHLLAGEYFFWPTQTATISINAALINSVTISADCADITESLALDDFFLHIPANNQPWYIQLQTIAPQSINVSALWHDTDDPNDVKIQMCDDCSGDDVSCIDVDLDKEFIVKKDTVTFKIEANAARDNFVSLYFMIFGQPNSH